MLIIAYKNIWRNKRRTLITAASVFFAVFFVIIMRGFQLGVWVNLVDGVLHSYSGYIQVHAKGYWDNRSFDYSMSEKEISTWNFTKNTKPTLAWCLPTSSYLLPETLAKD